MQAAAWTPGARRTRHPPQHNLTAIIDSQFGLREHPGMTDSKDVVRPGEPGGRYICELLVSLPDSSA